MTNEELKSLETEVRDLLNQIVIKLKDVEDYDSENFLDEDGYESNPFYNDTMSDKQKLEAFLGCVKTYCKTAVDSNGALLVEYENKYHSSVCW